MKEIPTIINYCPFFEVCSGCSIKDIYNPPIWKEILLYAERTKIKDKPVLFFNEFEGSRYKAKLAIQNNNNNISIGLYKRNSHEVVDIPLCLVHQKAINAASIFLKDAIKKFNISIYCEKKAEGLLRYFQFFVQRKTQKVQLSVVLNKNDFVLTGKEKLFFDYICEEKDVFDSVWLNLNTKKENAIFGEKWELLSGNEEFSQEIGDLTLPFHPMSFAQSNIELFEKLIYYIKKELKNSYDAKSKKVLELYAGNGSIGLNLAKDVREMALVEKNPFSRIFFDTVKEKQEFKNVLFITEDASNIKINDDENDIIIVDPPRKGLEKEVLLELGEKKEGILVYVSCFFKSFSRDSDLLFKKGWKLKKIEGFLFFPGTNHVEVLGIFKKG